MYQTAGRRMFVAVAHDSEACRGEWAVLLASSGRLLTRLAFGFRDPNGLIGVDDA